MNDESPFASFVPSTEPPAAPKEGKKPRKNAKKAAAPKPEKAAAAPVKPKKERKPRAAKKPRAMMLPIGTLLELGGLNDIETSALSAIATSLQTVPKKSRARIAAALGKIFA